MSVAQRQAMVESHMADIYFRLSRRFKHLSNFPQPLIMTCAIGLVANFPGPQAMFVRFHVHAFAFKLHAFHRQPELLFGGCFKT
jgi:hypothetical protein